MEIKLAKVLPLGNLRATRGDWLLCGGRHRDSEIIEESNFDAILKILGGESDTLEIHRFGHFAVGWIEEILVHPSRRAEVEAIKARLDNYPILDEEDFSQREYEAGLSDED